MEVVAVCALIACGWFFILEDEVTEIRYAKLYEGRLQSFDCENRDGSAAILFNLDSDDFLGFRIAHRTCSSLRLDLLLNAPVDAYYIRGFALQVATDTRVLLPFSTGKLWFNLTLLFMASPFFCALAGSIWFRIKDRNFGIKAPP